MTWKGIASTALNPKLKTQQENEILYLNSN